jgi:purine-nucleoside phosphorylase
VVFGVRLLASLNVQAVILTNAAGGIADNFTPGTLMLLEDHLNLTGKNPLIGSNDDRFGPRFPDMSEVYSKSLREIARQVASALDLPLASGVYAGLLGPSYETPAEVRMLRGLGASAVGMSTVLEAIALTHQKVPLLGISCITNLAAGLAKHQLSHEEVSEVAGRASANFCALVEGFCRRLAGS